MADKRKTITISVRDDFSQQLKALARQLDAAQGELSDLQGTTKRSGSGFAAMAANVDHLTTALRNVWSIGTSVVGTLIDMGNTGAQIQQSAFAFERLAGGAQNASAWITAIQQASRGSLTEFEATNQAIQLMTMGLADSAEEAGRFMEIAAITKAINPELGTMENTITNIGLTLANDSWMRLDQLGVDATKAKARIEELKEEGMAMTEAFDVAVIEQLEEHAAQIGTEVLDIGKNSAEMQANFREAKDSASQFAAVVMDKIAPSLGDAASAAVLIFDTLTNLADGTWSIDVVLTAIMNEITGTTGGNIGALNALEGNEAFKTIYNAYATIAGQPQLNEENIGLMERGQQLQQMQSWMSSEGNLQEFWTAQGALMAEAFGPVLLAFRQEFVTTMMELPLPLDWLTAQAGTNFSLDNWFLPGRGGEGAAYPGTIAGMPTLPGRSGVVTPEDPKAYLREIFGTNLPVISPAELAAAIFGVNPPLISTTGTLAPPPISSLEQRGGLPGRDPGMFPGATLPSRPDYEAMKKMAHEAAEYSASMLEAAAASREIESLSQKFGLAATKFDVDVFGEMASALRDAGVETEIAADAMQTYQLMTGMATGSSELFQGQLDRLSEALAAGSLDADDYVQKVLQLGQMDLSAIDQTISGMIAGGDVEGAKTLLDELSEMDFTELQDMLASLAPQEDEGNQFQTIMNDATAMQDAVTEATENTKTTIVENFHAVNTQGSEEFSSLRENAISELDGIKQHLQEGMGFTMTITATTTLTGGGGATTAPGGPVPTFQEGGFTGTGTMPFLAMLHPNEYVIPLNQLQARGSGGMTIGTIIINDSGDPVKTWDKLAQEARRRNSTSIGHP